jgi:sugar/nucleoside kinase (ribokinase family)
MRRAKQPRVMVCGPVVHEIHMRVDENPRADRYVTIERMIHSLGGSGAFAGLAVAACGIETTVVAPRAADEYAARAQATLQKRGVQWVGTCRPEQTPVFYSMCDPSGARWVVHEKCLFEAEHLPDPTGYDFIILGPSNPTDALKIAESARASGVPLMFAPSASLCSYMGVFHTVAQRATWLLLNFEEAERYGQRSDTADAVQALICSCPNMVVTRGDMGATLIVDHLQVPMGTATVRPWTDAGAGDVLAGAFCARMVAEQLPPPRALEVAQNVVGRFLERGGLALEDPAVVHLLEVP